MRIRFFYVVIAVFLLSSFMISAQENDENDENDLLITTLSRDIETADYYEIVSWCQSLGLPAEGTLSALRGQLYSFYGISRSPSRQQSSTGGTEIIIESASRTDYFNVETVDEKMVIFSGNVILKIKERESAKTHVIKADQIIFNRELETLTALGNIEYELTGDGNQKTFNGDSLTFSVENWSGVIFYGQSESEEKVDEKKQLFYFDGESIRRSEENVVVMDRGTITTRESEDPDFNIRARKIWVTGPEEWGMLHGLLYMGNVPVLYIPFYFKPGNDLFFNPALGFDEHDGYFIQTTTYFYGQKNYGDSNQFFQLGNAEGDLYELERIGLYNFKVKKLQEKNSDYIRFMADYYSQLGVFSAVDINFSKLLFMQNFESFAGIALSRNIDDGDNFFIYDELDAEYYEEWNEPYILGNQIPFRFGANLSFGWEKVDLKFAFYSDPYFHDHFTENRSEDFDWLNYVLSDVTSDEENTTTSTNTITNYDWSVTIRNLSINTGILKPYINNLNFQEISAKINWASTSDDSITADYDPTRLYFYPNEMTLPNIKASMSGTLFDYPFNSSTDVSQDSGNSEDSGNLELLTPWEDEEESETETETSTISDLIMAEIRDDLNVQGQGKPFTLNLGYSLTPDFTLSTTKNGDELNSWTSGADAEWIMDPAKLYSITTLNFTLKSSIADQLISYTGKTDLKGAWSEHYDIFGSDFEITDDIKEDDYERRYTTWDFSNNVQIKPLKNLPYVSNSSVSYNLDGIFWKRYFEEMDGDDPVFTDEWAGWNDERISAHNISASLKFEPRYITFTSTYKTDLEPMETIDQSLTNQLDVLFGPFSCTVTQPFVNLEDDGYWKPNDFSFDAYLKFFDNNLVFYQDFKYSYEEETLTNSTSKIEAWGFVGKYTMLYTEPQDFDLENRVYIAQEKEFIPSTLFFSYDYDFDSGLLWFNRFRWKIDLGVSWNINLVKPAENNMLDFSLQFHTNLHEFIDLTFKISSANKHMYLYFEEWRDYYGIEQEYNFFEELFQSFNVFNDEDRRNSHFNLNTMDLTLTHHLRDWDVIVGYSGSMVSEDGEYLWKPELNITVTLNPIPSISNRIQNKDDEWSIDAGKEENN